MSTYVVQGLVYFATHPRLWLLTLCPLVLTLIVGMATAIVLFAVALVPQVEGLEQIGITSWLSWMLAVLLVLVEVFFLTLIYNLVVMGSRSCRSCCRVSLWLRLVLLIVTLPLNLLPIVGSIMYAWLNGTILAWEYHLRYFEFKNFTYAQQKAFINEHKLEYSSFGMQALLMEMIPGLGSLFVFTNAVGSALLAAHLEEDECERTVEKR